MPILDTVFYFGGTVLGFFETCCVTTFKALKLVSLLSFVARYSDGGAFKKAVGWMDWIGWGLCHPIEFSLLLTAKSTIMVIALQNF